MTSFYNALAEFHIGTTARAILLIILGFIVAKILSASINKALRRRLTPQQSMLLRRITFYLILLLFLTSAIQQLGFHIGALLGATGILTVAVGIASQTSMSNIISGLFIIGEKPFEIGNTIRVNEIQGEVIAIDFLSVKIRTNENTMVRIPNEILIKSAITNISFFSIRRAELIFVVAYQSDLNFVKKILFEIAEKNLLCLAEPKPSLLIQGFNDLGIIIHFFAWSTNENFNELKNTMQDEIKTAFLENGIDIPFSSHLNFVGSETQPLAIKIMAQR